MEERQVQEQNQDERPAISRPPSLKKVSPYPWLVMFDCPGDTRQTFYSILDNRFHVRNIREMQNKIIVSSRQGWLFLKDNVTDSSSLFNMFTLENLQLPPDPYKSASHNFVISSCPNKDAACRALVIMGFMSKFKSCYLGDSKFVERRLSYDSLGRIFAVVNCGGRLYGLAHGSWDLLVADFEDPQLHFTRIFGGDRIWSMKFKLTDDMKLYLIEMNGEVVLVYTNRLNHDGLDIKILKADLVMKKWVEIKSLGDRALFLDSYKGMSSSSPASTLGLRCNCVYYVNTFNDRNLYVYDMNNRDISVSLPCSIVSNKRSSLFWAM